MQPMELRALLAELEIVQEDFGRALGVGQKTAQRWVAEGGSVPGPVAIVAALIKRHPQLRAELGIGRKGARGRPLAMNVRKRRASVRSRIGSRLTTA